jgi:hypothetical protein
MGSSLEICCKTLHLEYLAGLQHVEIATPTFGNKSAEAHQILNLSSYAHGPTLL